MFEAVVNEHHNFQLKVEGDSILIDDSKAEMDIHDLGAGRFHIIKDSKGYNISIISIDRREKLLKVKVDQNEYSVALKGKMDLLLEKLGIDNVTTQGKNDIKAPMPGLILDVLVGVGDEVQKGTPLLILEAMKMENIIKSPGDGLVSDVLVKVGASVEKNHTLLVL